MYLKKYIHVFYIFTLTLNDYCSIQLFYIQATFWLKHEYDNFEKEKQ